MFYILTVTFKCNIIYLPDTNITLLRIALTVLYYTFA
nr:MAG TPA: hypothetical protein [Caudoviricetes sp.]